MHEAQQGAGRHTRLFVWQQRVRSAEWPLAGSGQVRLLSRPHSGLFVLQSSAFTVTAGMCAREEAKKSTGCVRATGEMGEGEGRGRTGQGKESDRG